MGVPILCRMGYGELEESDSVDVAIWVASKTKNNLHAPKFYLYETGFWFKGSNTDFGFYERRSTAYRWLWLTPSSQRSNWTYWQGNGTCILWVSRQALMSLREYDRRTAMLIQKIQLERTTSCVRMEFWWWVILCELSFKCCILTHFLQLMGSPLSRPKFLDFLCWQSAPKRVQSH